MSRITDAIGLGNGHTYFYMKLGEVSSHHFRNQEHDYLIDFIGNENNTGHNAFGDLKKE